MIDTWFISHVLLIKYKNWKSFISFSGGFYMYFSTSCANNSEQVNGFNVANEKVIAMYDSGCQICCIAMYDSGCCN